MSDDKRPMGLLILRNAREWRKWLKDNHDKESEVWLKIRKATSKDEGIFLSEAVTEALCFGWIDSKMSSIDEMSYILRFTPRKSGSFWSKINKQQ